MDVIGLDSGPGCLLVLGAAGSEVGRQVAAGPYEVVAGQAPPVTPCVPVQPPGVRRCLLVAAEHEHDTVGDASRYTPMTLQPSIATLTGRRYESLGRSIFATLPPCVKRYPV